MREVGKFLCRDHYFSYRLCQGPIVTIPIMILRKPLAGGKGHAALPGVLSGLRSKEGGSWAVAWFGRAFSSVRSWPVEDASLANWAMNQPRAVRLGT